ncbi:DUF4176 domain-containing protein [Brevibacillus daliensis]|uniref:DUF4176 domain-containing protein n=1 Tax=Brevibacillus daliensis TaxID=2892995 RepID=UPI001E41E833|nr:DUF4176 domain-containing protein [Brevibacillus daliensis]
MSQSTQIQSEVKEIVDLLPIGSVVKLVGWDQKIMIYGRMQIQANTEEIFDYVGCPHPHGNISKEYNVFFRQNQINEILFRGYEDEEELQLRKKLIELEAAKKDSPPAQ